MRIKELREKMGLTQKQLGEKLGARQNAVSNWERGIRTPDTETLNAMADLFEVSVDYLIGRSSWNSRYLDEESRPTARRLCETEPSGLDRWRRPDRPSAHDSDTIRILSRGARRLDGAQQEQLLEMARLMFREAFSDDDE